ncbi:unnamed protein product [Owenia fusiformis]|uniref:Uncharacterized protein n=1 Tax=Owenia fusiformis TaxID=6347 RepID=A0A8J1XKX9_OWEFU|nr:unnamed protein product [Owenia fusiformis]
MKTTGQTDENNRQNKRKQQAKQMKTTWKTNENNRHTKSENIRQKKRKQQAKQIKHMAKLLKIKIYHGNSCKVVPSQNDRRFCKKKTKKHPMLGRKPLDYCVPSISNLVIELYCV